MASGSSSKSSRNNPKLEVVEDYEEGEEGVAPTPEETMRNIEERWNDMLKIREGISSDMNKLKDMILYPTMLRIGGYRATGLGVFLRAKFLFRKQVVIWQMKDALNDNIRIVVPLNIILSSRAVMEENKPGLLEIELKVPPTFSFNKGTNATEWESDCDFTNFHASKHRIHQLQFEPGVLQELLGRNDLLVQLSRRRFPTKDSPIFGPDSGAALTYSDARDPIKSDPKSSSVSSRTSFESSSQSISDHQQGGNPGTSSDDSEGVDPYENPVLSSQESSNSKTSSGNKRF